MNELMQSLFDFIEEHAAAQEAQEAAAAEKKTAEPGFVAQFPTRTCSRNDEFASLADLPVRSERGKGGNEGTKEDGRATVRLQERKTERPTR